MSESTCGQFSVRYSSRRQLIDNHKVDQVRRLLWRAFQSGRLSDDELASALDRLEFATSGSAPSWSHLRDAE